MFGEIFQNVVPKPAKASGTQWIAHKSTLWKKFYQITVHLESLTQTDLQARKCNELIGYSKKPIKVISLEMQQETYNPAGQLKHITDFTKRFVVTKY